MNTQAALQRRRRTGELLARLERIPEAVVLLLNALLGLFILVAHGGLLLFIQLGKISPIPPYHPVLWVTTTVALCIVVTAAIAAALSSLRGFILQVQAATLGVLCMALVATVVYWAVAGLPEGNFSWTPGFFSAIVVYCALLVCRFILRPLPRFASLAGQLPVTSLAVALVLEAVLLARLVVWLYQHFAQHW